MPTGLTVSARFRVPCSRGGARCSRMNAAIGARRDYGFLSREITIHAHLPFSAEILRKRKREDRAARVRLAPRDPREAITSVREYSREGLPKEPRCSSSLAIFISRTEPPESPLSSPSRSLFRGARPPKSVRLRGSWSLRTSIVPGCPYARAVTINIFIARGHRPKSRGPEMRPLSQLRKHVTCVYAPGMRIRL